MFKIPSFEIAKASAAFLTIVQTETELYKKNPEIRALRKNIADELEYRETVAKMIAEQNELIGA